MIRDRKGVVQYAEKVCLPMLRRTARRLEKGQAPNEIDYVGYVPTFLEELCRPFWGLAPLLKEKDYTLAFKGREVDLCDFILERLVCGTEKGGSEAWDRFRNDDWGLDFQNLTELAGLLIGLYFVREKTWDKLKPEQQKQIADWIFSCCRGQCAHPAGNNHVWFPVFCVLVLKRFGFVYPETEDYLKKGLDQFEKLYLGQGWYHDGGLGRFDYYEAWSLHAYPLLWCLLEDPTAPGYSERKQSYLARTEEFLRQYLYFFDAHGAHMPFGRSLSYRFAASCVFPLYYLAGGTGDPGRARNAMLQNLSFFEENVRVPEDGVLPPGYLYASPALTENYTSDGGAYWCTKTFLCLLLPEDHPFWTAKEKPLPAQEGEFRVSPRPGFVLQGGPKTGVTLLNNACTYYQSGRYWNPFNDMASYYHKFAYNSLVGFALSTHDNLAPDSMISLSTPDDSLFSHRHGFTRVRAFGEGQTSRHEPFANDPETYIDTLLYPLEDGAHLRIHRVTLNKPYVVTEGGFLLPRWSDEYVTERTAGTLSVRADGLTSYFAAVGSVPIDVCKMRAQPGMALYAPQATVPAYRTGVLAPGTYYFACVSGVTESEAPTVHLTMDENTVTCGGKEFDLRELNECWGREEMKLGFSTLGCMEATLPEVIAYAKNNGITGIEPRVDAKLTTFAGLGLTDAPEIKKAVEEAGLVITDLALGCCFTSDDPAAVEAGKAGVEFASAVGAKAVRVFAGPGQNRFSEQVTVDIDGIARAIRALADAAAKMNVGIWIETHSALSTAASLRPLLDAVDRPNVKVLWDLIHSVEYGEDPETTVALLGSKIAHVHLKDGVKEADPDLTHFKQTDLLCGTVPVTACRRALERTGYTGFYSLEWEAAWIPELKAMYSDFNELLKKYRTFAEK